MSKKTRIKGNERGANSSLCQVNILVNMKKGGEKFSKYAPKRRWCAVSLRAHSADKTACIRHDGALRMREESVARSAPPHVVLRPSAREKASL